MIQAMVRPASLPAELVRDSHSPPPDAATDISELPLFSQAAPTKSGAASGRFVELRVGRVGMAQLKLHSSDPALIYGDVAARVRAAPQLFDGAPVIFDLTALPTPPSERDLRAISDAVHAAGLRPVGLAAGDEAVSALAQALDWPLFAKFLAGREAASLSEPVEELPEPSSAPCDVTSVPVDAPVQNVLPPRPSGLHHAEPVRSGQRIYAQDTDLTIASVVGHGAEVIADGSIHVYGALRGRALAGARGEVAARIYCQNFQAELVAIAGQYRVFEEPVAELHGKPVQVWLEGDKLRLAALS